MKSKVLIILMLSFAILFGQHSKDYQGITAPHYHPGEPGFDQNNCVGYALGRAEGKLAGDHYCDPTEIYATRINNYIFHAFPHTGEIGDYNMLPGDIIVWGSAYLSNPYGPNENAGHAAYVVSVPANLSLVNLDDVGIEHVLQKGGGEITNNTVEDVLNQGVPVGYFDVPRGVTFRSTFGNDFSGNEGGIIKVRPNLLAKDQYVYQDKPHPYHDYCPIILTKLLDIMAVDMQNINNQIYEFLQWNRDGILHSSNIELDDEQLNTSVVYEALFNPYVDPLSVDVSGPTLLIGTQELTKAPQYHATGTWEANASGGVGNYAYQWQYYGYYGWTDYVGETGDEMTKTLYYDSDGHDLRCVVTSGSETASDEIHVFVTGEISFKSTPNPFNPTTKISFVLNKQQNVELIIYSIMGRKIKTVVNSNLDVGQHSYLWDGTDANGKPVSSGTYIYQLKAGNDVYNHRVVFTK